MAGNPIHIATNNIYKLAETITWGKASKIDSLALSDIHDWFQSAPQKDKGKVFFGAVLKIKLDSGYFRVYQGIFTKNNKCLLSRQVITRKLENEVESLFGENDLVIFAESEAVVSFGKSIQSN
jgi:hypothetical protein